MPIIIFHFMKVGMVGGLDPFIPCRRGYQNKYESIIPEYPKSSERSQE
jgi:hypothetical protein